MQLKLTYFKTVMGVMLGNLILLVLLCLFLERMEAMGDWDLNILSLLHYFKPVGSTQTIQQTSGLLSCFEGFNKSAGKYIH